jgi:hypothetical protein
MAIDQLGPFADAEAVLRIYLGTQLPGVTIVSATGTNLPTPTVLVRRIGGDNDRFTDFATMLISVFGGTRPESIALAAQVAAHLLNATNTVVPLAGGGRALIDGASVTEADHPELYDNPDLRHVSAAYELRMRRPKPA